jgi:O-antigen ligase/tetratricopeptide (TPR) repeat protein
MKDFLKWSVFAGLFAVPFLTLYVADDLFFPYITGKNFWFRIIIDFTLVSWILLALYDSSYRPKFSWIATAFAALLGVMFFANLFGVNPNSSFWSNFERMDGYVSLVHTFLYMLILGSVLTTNKLWAYLLNTSLIVAGYVALYGLAQYLGWVPGSDRIDSTLGNAAYMAIYMLFHIFIALWLLVASQEIWQKVLYGLSIPILTFVLVETGTRGTAVGLGVGAAVTLAYIGLFGTQFKQFRKYAIGGFILLLIAVGGFVAARDSDFVQEQPNLARIANISIADLQIRGIIWGMAWEGVQERPILGYGQSNFNYVFNEHYDPRLYAQEQWFDRGHNIFMDWLVTGGFLGLFVYLSIFLACAYYLFWRPWRDENDQAFTVIERAVLLGLLAGYFTHNLVVFDNIVSYIFFAVILGLIHSRVATPIKAIATKKIDEAAIAQVALPLLAIVFAATVYFVHMPGMAAAGDIIKAYGTARPTVVAGVQQPPAGPEAMLEQFRTAIERDSFAHQEITEQLSQQAMSLARNPQVDTQVQAAFAAYSEEQLLRLVKEKPGDARVHVFVASYYRATNQLDRAAAEMAIARELSPEKQTIIIQQGFIAFAQSQNQTANEFFKIAFELDERNPEAREYYAASLLYMNDIDGATALLDTEATKARFANSEFLLGAANQAQAGGLLIELFSYRLEADPTVAQNWATLAFLYYNQPDIPKAVELLLEAQVVIPTFASTSNCIIGNIEAGIDPQLGC